MLLAVAYGLAETLGSVVDVGEEGGVVAVQRVEITGELQPAKKNLNLWVSGEDCRVPG